MSNKKKSRDKVIKQLKAENKKLKSQLEKVLKKDKSKKLKKGKK